jgi:hypothetical protein
MSSINPEPTADERFRQALERLKANNPKVLALGTPVSQNNVAKEAGCDPSALRKSRFPSLVREIQAYVELKRDAGPSARQATLKERADRLKERDKLADVGRQRDVALSQLGSANRRLIELTQEVQMLRLRLAELQPTPSTLARPRPK